MAAAELPGYIPPGRIRERTKAERRGLRGQRLCQREGCTVSLFGRGPRAVECFQHALDTKRAMNREYNAEYRKKCRAKSGLKRCEYCEDMPHAREPGRMTVIRNVGNVPVADENGDCNGCGLAYEPEPPIERCEVLRSNASGTFGRNTSRR